MPISIAFKRVQILKAQAIQVFRWLLVSYIVCGVGNVYSSGPDLESEGQYSIRLLWTERAPFQYTGDDGNPAGLLVDIGREIFKKAKLPHTEAMLPANRVIFELTKNTRPVCAVGWYKSEERQVIAQFSKPVYHDKPLRAVFRKDANVAIGASASEVLTTPNTRILIKQGFAYGEYLDNILNTIDLVLVQRVTGNPNNMLLMIKAGRADLVLLAQEEIDFYIKSDPSFNDNFKVVVFKDIPETDRRFIMCSKNISVHTLNRINAAIDALSLEECKKHGTSNPKRCSSR